MKTINLRDFYYWYTEDEFVEVTDEVAAVMIGDEQRERVYQRRIRRNEAQYSLDADDGIELDAVAVLVGVRAPSPEAAVGMMERHCGLCQALNSLPEVQARRIVAHYCQGVSQQEIADEDGVTRCAVNISIQKGLADMKVILRNFQKQA